MPTIPALSHPVTITAPASGNHITITYTDASTQGVDLASGTYYIQADNSATDLFEALETALETASNITTASTTFSSSQLVTLRTRGAKDVNLLTFDTTIILPYHFGFATSTATTTVTVTPGSPDSTAVALYRPPSFWCPSTEDFDDLQTRKDVAVSQGADDGGGVDDIYTGHVSSAHWIPEVFGVLIRNTLASDANHVANVSGLSSGDTNAALDSWLVSYHALLGGARPTCRWTPDVGTMATFRSVKVGGVEMLGSVEGWIEDTNEAPLFHDLRFTLAEV